MYKLCKTFTVVETTQIFIVIPTYLLHLFV